MYQDSCKNSKHLKNSRKSHAKNSQNPHSRNPSIRLPFNGNSPRCRHKSQTLQKLSPNRSLQVYLSKAAHPLPLLSRPSFESSSYCRVGTRCKLERFTLTKCYSYGLVLGTGAGLVRETAGLVLGHYFRKRREFVEMVVQAGAGVGIVLFSVFYREAVG